MVWKAAAVMLVYAVLMIAVGLVTYLVAPPGAGAITALLVPGGIGVLTGLCGLVSLKMDSNRALGMLGIHAGLILPLLAAIGAGSMVVGGITPARDAGQHFAEVNRALKGDGRALVMAVDQAGATPADIEASGADVVVSKESGLHPTGYKVVGQAGVVALSALAFVSLLLHRPNPSPKPASNPAPPPPSRGRRDDGE